ncbi:MAG: hypothetical protein Q8M08_14905 [Bacteroidales bacterium]|nr:hypothetical protein [Bacteroidales bacterium]
MRKTSIFTIFILLAITLQSQDKNIYEIFTKSLTEVPLEYSMIDQTVDKYLTVSENIDENISDSLFSILFRSIVRGERILNDKLYEEENIDDYRSLIWADEKLQKKNALEFEKRLIAHNIKISSSEGMIHINYNFEGKKEALKSRLTKSGRELFDLLIVERDIPAVEDAGLIISLREVVDRLITWETLLHSNPHSMIDLKNDRFYFYLEILIYGLDNTPLTYDSDTIEKQFIDAYAYMIEKYPGYKSTEEIKRYYHLIKDNNFKFNDEIGNFKF